MNVPGWREIIAQSNYNQKICGYKCKSVTAVAFLVLGITGFAVCFTLSPHASTTYSKICRWGTFGSACLALGSLGGLIYTLSALKKNYNKKNRGEISPEEKIGFLEEERQKQSALIKGPEDPN